MNKPVKEKNADPNPVENQDDIKKTPEDAVKEPLKPVPAIDEINPPL